MTILYVKALHIIFVVTWFAGLFYIVRLFIYYAEAEEKSEPEKSILQKQYKLMEKRLWYGITWPSAILTLGFGLWMLHFHLQMYTHIQSWMWMKIGFLVGLYLYHFSCQRIFNQHQKGLVKQTSNQLRLWNEVATVFLFAIIFLVVLKNNLSFLWGIAGLIVFSIILMLAIRIYKRLRTE